MFRNFFKRKKAQEPKIESERVHSNKIETWLDKKTKEVNENEKKVFVLIEKEIDSFTLRVEGKTKILRAIDIESKKVEERAKTIVRQGLDEYLNFVEIFKKDLADIEKQKLNQFIKKADKAFSSFDKRSYIFYQRANYLIGDELVALKQEINNLSTHFTGLFDKNKKISQSFDLISSTKSKLTRLDETNIALDKINLEIKSLDKKTTENEEKGVKIIYKIKKIKVSKNYLENIKRKDEIELTEKQLEENILELKSLINFKKLANTFHSNEGKMKRIKDYRDDFQKSFTRNKGRGILNLIKEAELDDGSIFNKIKQIEEKESRVHKNKKLIKKDEVKELLEEAEKIKSEIENLASEKNKYIKRSEKIQENKKTILKSIAPNITELGGNLC